VQSRVDRIDPLADLLERGLLRGIAAFAGATYLPALAPLAERPSPD